MKKYIIYLSVALLGLSLTSCEDFLKEEAFGNPTTEELMKDPENMSKLVGQAYAELKWLHDHWGYWGLNTLTSDEARCPVRNPGNNWDDNGYWLKLNTMEWDYNTLAFELVWEKCIAGATLCNKILKQLEPYKDLSTYPRFEAELCVLRTYYYYTMFDMFGRLPYTEEFPTSESVQFPLNERQEVWQKMVDCLKKYTPILPVATDPSKAMNYGRVTQGAGYTLLARLYFNAESFDVTPDASPYAECVKYCDMVINSGVYHCESNFFNNFTVHNENSEENILVIVENGNASFDYQDMAGKMCNKLRLNLLTQPYAFQTYYDLLEKPWNGFAASPQFLDKYEEGDRRGPCGENDGTDIDFQNVNTKFGWFIGPVKSKVDGSIVKDENGKEVIITREFNSDPKSCTWHAGARCMKYETEIGSTVNKYMENDFVLLRYADVLLMKAEACVRGGGNVGTVLSNSDFILIRTRAGLEQLGNVDLDEILDERGRELAWENTRRRDLIRHEKYTGDAYQWQYKKEGVEPWRKWFPIPRKYIEMHANDEKPWRQNDGYLQ